MKAQLKFYKTLPASLFIFILLFIFYTAIMPGASFGKSSFVSNLKPFNQDEFTKKFREGRDLIDQEDWANAAKKFAEITEKYPKNKSADAALYWLAFCYRKQQKPKEVRATVERLIKDFPESSWVGDAKVLLLDSRYQSTTDSLNAMSKRLSASSKSLENSSQLFEELSKSMTAEFPLDGNPLERDDEIKLAAFQNLLASDMKKAIETAAEVLGEDSKAGEMLKRQIARAFRKSRFIKTQTAGGESAYVRTTTTVNKEYLPLLRDVLQKSFQNEKNDKVRAEVIYTLANIDDAESINYLLRAYSSTDNIETKKTIIYSFGSSNLSLSGTYKGTKINAVPATTVIDKNIHFEKLFDFIRTEKNSYLRRTAFSTLQRFVGWSTKTGILEMLSRIYDAEADEQFKISIINAFGNLKNNQATAKLMDIAKNDKNEDLRILAINDLRKNKDPKVISFLESLPK